MQNLSEIGQRICPKYVCFYVCVWVFLSVCVCVCVCVLEGDTGVNSQTFPIPLPQKLISSRPNPTKKLGEWLPFPPSPVLLFFFAEICLLQ